MAIGNAIHKGSTVYIYDDKNRQTASISCPSGGNNGLKGYTGSQVNIQKGSTIYSYDERGCQISSRSA